MDMDPGVQETEAEEAAGYALIFEMLDEIAALPKLREIVVEPGSMLHADGEIQDYDPPAHLVVFQAAVATDHLDAFARLLKAEGSGLHVYAGFTLIRSAIEAAATGIWLRSGGKANVRVARSLWMIVHTRDETRSLASSLGVLNDVGYKNMRRRVDGIIADRKGLFPNILERHFTKTNIIIEADRHVPKDGLAGLQAWQACSGMAHGNRTTTLMFQERSPLSTNGKTTDYYITASAKVTVLALSVATRYLSTLTRMYQDQAKA